LIQDNRFGDIIDAADSLCGYHWLANDILQPTMFNSRLRTDTIPVWTLDVIGDWEPPHNRAYEVFWFHGKDCKWHQQHRQSFQAAIQVLSDSPFEFMSGNNLPQQVNLFFWKKSD
jgi:hypothetical protein